MDSKEQNERTNRTGTNSQIQSDGKGAGGVGKGEGVAKYKPAVTKRSRDVKYSAGERAGDIVITRCGVGRVPA